MTPIVDVRRSCNTEERARALAAGLAAARELVAAGRHWASCANGVTTAMADTIGVQPINLPTAFKPCSMDDFINAAHHATRAAAAAPDRTTDSVAAAIEAATKELL